MANLRTTNLPQIFIARLTTSSLLQRSAISILLLGFLSAGATAQNMKLFKGKKLPAGTIGDASEDDPPPALKGDAVLLLDPSGDGRRSSGVAAVFAGIPLMIFTESKL